MANYTVKLVDHTTGTATNLLQAIQRDTQSLFDEAFAGTKLTLSVSWGIGTASDNYVAHFVEDKTAANSYLRGTFPNMNVNPAAEGHTASNKVITGTEIYKFADASRNQARGMGYAKMIVHESLHNLFPFLEKPGAKQDGSDPDTVHGTWGGGGIALKVPAIGTPPNRLNQRNKDLIIQGFSVKNAQLL